MTIKSTQTLPIRPFRITWLWLRITALDLGLFRFNILGHFHGEFEELSSLTHLVYFKLWLDIISEHVLSFVTTI